MLRALLVILVVANALFFAWSQRAFDGMSGTKGTSEREPERLSRQVNPDQVRLLNAPAASAAIAAAAASARAASEAAAARTAAVTGTCMQAGPVPTAGLGVLEQMARDAGLAAGAWTAVSGERKGLFLIYLGKFEDDEALGRKQEELKQLRIEAQPVRNVAALQPGLVVARYDDKAQAEAELARLNQRGLRTARVVAARPGVALTTLRVPAATDAQRDKLLALKPPAGVPGFSRCEGTAPPGAAASGTVEASAPSR
jgi:hypothetical protein